MGFNRIAKALALMAVVSMAATAQAADDRLSMWGYFRVSEGWQISPNKTHQGYYGLGNTVGGSKFRLGNENDWAEFGWNLLAYKGEDGTIGHVVIGLGGNYNALNQGGGDNAFAGWQGGGTAVFKQLMVDVQKIPGLDATLWLGKKYYKRYYSPINDMFVWSDDGFGAGIEDINLQGLKLSYAVFDAGHGGTSQGAFHDLRLTDIAIMPGGHIDVGVGFAHKISEDAGQHGGYMANVRWVQDIMGGNNQLFLQYGAGPCAASQFGSNQGGGIDLSRIPQMKKARFADALSISPSKELGIDFLLMLENNSAPGSTADIAGTGGSRLVVAGTSVGAGNNWNAAQVGARVSFHFASHASLLLEAGYDYVKPVGIDASTLIKVTPAIEVGTGFGNVPHIRLFATFASWNDQANAAAGVPAAVKNAIGAIGTGITGVGLANPPGSTATTAPTSALSVGLQGEAWF